MSAPVSTACTPGIARAALGIDRDDAGVRVRRRDERRPQHPRPAGVGGVLGLPGDFCAALDAALVGGQERGETGGRKGGRRRHAGQVRPVPGCSWGSCGIARRPREAGRMANQTAVRADVFASNEIRIEGHGKVSGKLQYTADVRRPETLWAAFAISPIAFGKIRKIDTAAAKAVAGVRAVLTAADIGERRVGRNLYDWPVLCYDYVRFIGDRVAAVAADTREIAEQAAALIEIEFEELPADVESRDALKADAPVLHPDRDSYYFKAFAGKEPPKRAHANIQGTAKYRKGETDLAPLFASAHKVFEHHFVSPRQHAGYIEPRSTIVWLDGDDTVHVVTPNKQPFNVREQMSNVTGLPKEKIVVEPSGIGGDFGGKGMTVDEFACYYLAKATRRPVRFVETYTDELRAATTRHRAHVTLKTAVDAQGNLIAHQSTVLLNGGAYAGGKPSPQLLPSNGYALVPYQVPNVGIDITNVYTNTLPTAHVRSPMAARRSTSAGSSTSI